MTELKKLEERTISFKANGRKYRVTSDVSIQRLIESFKYEQEAAHQMGFWGLYKANNEIIEHLKKNDIYEASVTAHKIASGMAITGKENRLASLYLCALFVNYEGEDVRYITEDLIKEKIHDWEEAGIEVTFFLKLAKFLIPSYARALALYSESQIKGANLALERELELFKASMIESSQTSTK